MTCKQCENEFTMRSAEDEFCSEDCYHAFWDAMGDDWEEVNGHDLGPLGDDEEDE